MSKTNWAVIIGLGALGVFGLPYIASAIQNIKLFSGGSGSSGGGISIPGMPGIPGISGISSQGLPGIPGLPGVKDVVSDVPNYLSAFLDKFPKVGWGSWETGGDGKTTPKPNPNGGGAGEETGNIFTDIRGIISDTGVTGVRLGQGLALAGAGAASGAVGLAGAYGTYKGIQVIAPAVAPALKEFGEMAARGMGNVFKLGAANKPAVEAGSEVLVKTITQMAPRLGLTGAKIGSRLIPGIGLGFLAWEGASLLGGFLQNLGVPGYGDLLQRLFGGNQGEPAPAPTDNRVSDRTTAAAVTAFGSPPYVSGKQAPQPVEDFPYERGYSQYAQSPGAVAQMTPAEAARAADLAGIGAF